MQVVVKKIGDLTRDEYRYCYNANMGHFGQMQSRFSNYRRDELSARRDNARAFMLVDDSLQGARALLAWALVFDDSVYFWTKPSHRNKGYGTVLMREVKKEITKPTVYPWTNESGGFFSKFDVRDGYGDGDFWMTDKPKVC